MKIKSFLCGLALALCASVALIPLAGCSVQDTTVDIIRDTAAGVTAYLTLKGQPDKAATVAKDAAAAESAVAGWVKGTPTQDVVQVLNVFVADLNLYTLSDDDNQIIIIAVTTVESLISDFGGTPTPTPDTMAAARALSATASVSVTKAPPMATLKALRAGHKAKWNAAVAAKYPTARIK